MNQPSGDTIEIDFDFRGARAEAERSGTLAEHAELITAVSGDVRRLVATRPDLLNASVRVDKMETTAVPSKFHAAQVIDAVAITLAPLAMKSVAKLIVDVVKTCRTRMRTTFLLHQPGVPDVVITGSSEDVVRVYKALNLAGGKIQIEGGTRDK